MGVVGVLIAAGVAAAIAIVVNRSDDDAGTSVGEPRRGGTLVVAAVDLPSLDPADARDPSAVMLADHIFDTLVAYDPETLGPVPGVAESWDSSFDQRRFTFTVRDGLTFHDGSALGADDVVATLQRIAAPGSDSDFRFLLENVTGYPAYHDDKTAESLAGVKLIDERRVSIELVQPFSGFPVVLGNPGFGIVPTELAAGDSLATTPVGSGPLRFEGRRGDVITLARNDGYQPRPTWVDKVEVRLVADASSAYDAIEKGEVDLAPVPPERVNAAAGDYGEAGLGPFLGVLFYGMNAEAPVFEDVRMREAVVRAVDRRRIVEVVYNDTILLSDSFVPTGVPEAVANACGARCEHDPARAAQLVREAFPNGDVPTVQIDFDEDPVQRAVASAIRSDLEAAGVPAQLRPHEFKDYGVFLVNGDPQLFRLGWTADYPSADGFLFPLFVSQQRDNLTRLGVREIDQKLRSARAESDLGKRTELYRSAEQQILDRFPMLPIAQFTNRWAAATGVGGFAMTPLGTFAVTEVFLARATPGTGP